MNAFILSATGAFLLLEKFQFPVLVAACDAQSLSRELTAIAHSDGNAIRIYTLAQHAQAAIR